MLLNIRELGSIFLFAVGELCTMPNLRQGQAYTMMMHSLSDQSLDREGVTGYSSITGNYGTMSLDYGRVADDPDR